MKMSEHTPGPWVVLYSKKGYPYQICQLFIGENKGRNRVTRWASISFPGSIEGQANANLIAAAPELLEALKKATILAEYAVEGAYYGPGAAEIIAQARAAIEKAEGKQ
jgi:hypothetical protein